MGAELSTAPVQVDVADGAVSHLPGRSTVSPAMRLWSTFGDGEQHAVTLDDLAFVGVVERGEFDRPRCAI